MSFELKEQPAEQLAEYEKRINEIPLVIDPCKQCKNHSEEKGFESVCATCCWFYDSKFELRRLNEN